MYWIRITPFLLALGCGGSPPVPPVDWDGLDASQKKAKLMEMGRHVYLRGGTGGIACSACHGAEGAGMSGSFPPLAGSKEAMGDCDQHATYILKGASGPMTVQGVQYRGVMPAQPSLTDDEIAAVVTYERNSWGNDYGVCLPADVAALRKRLGL